MVKQVATNRKARHNYTIEETLEAGIVLVGSEVKSLRQGGCSLDDGFAVVKDGEVILRGVRIAPYKQASMFNVAPDRDRRLLLHRREIARLAGKVKERGYTLVPLRIYFKRGFAKVELGLGRGKKLYDKRRKLREEEERRRTEAALKRYARGQRV